MLTIRRHLVGRIGVDPALTVAHIDTLLSGSGARSRGVYGIRRFLEDSRICDFSRCATAYEEIRGSRDRAFAAPVADEGPE